ncbi:MAG: hypothetical protein ACREJ9_11885 [Candidatus Rokuibacteriota bacterium]
MTLPESVTDQPDSETWRDLYTVFGNAVYWAQTLEHTLVNVLALERLVRKERFTVDEFDQFMVRQFKQTLGQPIGILKANVDVKEGFADRLACALEVRNLLVHRYFRERVQDLTSDEGRRRLIEELSTFRGDLRSVHQELYLLMAPFRETVGISEDDLRRDIERLLAGGA